MHEVAVAAAIADRLLVLAAARVLEIGHGAKLRQDRTPTVEPTHQLLQSLLGVILLVELGVYIARQVVREVLAHAKLLELASNVVELLIDVFVKVLKVILQHVLVLRHRLARLSVELLRRRHILRTTTKRRPTT